MPPRNHRPGGFNAGAKQHRSKARQPFIAAVRDAESKSVQKKYSGMFDHVREKCNRSSPGRGQRESDYPGQRQPYCDASYFLRQHGTISIGSRRATYQAITDARSCSAATKDGAERALSAPRKICATKRRAASTLAMSAQGEPEAEACPSGRTVWTACT